MRAWFSFLSSAVIMALFCGSAATNTASTRTFSKSAMLEDLANTAIIRSYEDFAERSRGFKNAADEFVSNPCEDLLKTVRGKWVDAMLAWRSAQVFRSGPLVESNILSRIHFWPIRRQSVDKVLRDTRPITQTYISELGAAAVGLCALEHLLFGSKGANDAILRGYQGEENERRRLYLKALASDLVVQAERVTGEWTRKGGYKATFVAGGQESVNLIVNDMIQALEIATEERLKYAISLHENNLLKPEFIQGSLSGTSQRGVLSVLTGAQRLYLGEAGFGLKNHLRQIKSPLAETIETQFAAAFQAVKGIDAPLEDALLKDKAQVAKAYEECKKLEIVLKVDLVSALGVTLTFSSTDGD
jgi:predicted lipoprotein